MRHREVAGGSLSDRRGVGGCGGVMRPTGRNRASFVGGTIVPAPEWACLGCGQLLAIVAGAAVSSPSPAILDDDADDPAGEPVQFLE